MANESAPASHRSNDLVLPDIPVRLISAHGGNERRTSFAEALQGWQRSQSNLLVVTGAFGAGKTTGLTAFAAALDNDVGYLNFDELSSAGLSTTASKPIPQTTIVVFDNFDAINTLTGTQAEPPDLRDVSYLARTHRVIVATRRPASQRGDELLAQLQSPDRLNQLGFRAAEVLQLLPWELDDL